MPTISYEEAAELAFFGAKVVHPSTIQPAVDKNIKVWVKNTKSPTDEGTAIVHSDGKLGLRAITGKKNITLINISSSRMLNAYGFLSKIFNFFEKHRVSVDLVSTSEVSVSVTIDNTENLEALTKDLESLGTVRVESGKSIISLVGKDLWKDSSIIARAFSVLKEIPIRMVTLGSSDINLSVVVPLQETEDAMRKIHKEFFGS
jgi:aspartate kinase